MSGHCSANLIARFPPSEKPRKKCLFDALDIQNMLKILRHQFKGEPLCSAVRRAVTAAVHSDHTHETGKFGNLRIPVRAVLTVSVQQNERMSSPDIVAGDTGISAVNIFRFVPEHNPSYLSLFSQPSMCKYVSIV